ncbi:hypothetical protein SAMN06272721_11458 [Arthrobacter sp. P2b]|nr:hypothetical protein SAMN06272721_11458 [Arthrobacter sp. P2b]
MMVHMRHMGNSGKFAVICGIVAAGLLVLTGITLAEPVFVAFLGVLGLAYVAAVAEILARGRRFMLLAAGAGTSLTVGFALAFMGTWELAYDGQSSFLGTPLPTSDPDNYFIGAAASSVATLLVLFLGAAWPAGRRPGTPSGRQSPAQRRPAATTGRPGARSTATAQRASGSRVPGRVPAAAKRPSSSVPPVRTPAPKPGAGSAPRR